jgi:hypothetical protein
MHTDWMSPYHAALHEQDPVKLEELCELARHAMHNRMLELGTQPADAHEEGELEEALRQLTIHKYKGKPASRTLQVERKAG